MHRIGKPWLQKAGRPTRPFTRLEGPILTEANVQLTSEVLRSSARSPSSIAVRKNHTVTAILLFGAALCFPWLEGSGKDTPLVYADLSIHQLI